MTSSFDIDFLRSFVSVVQAGGVSRGAARIGRSQAAISMQMARLEEIVGKPLLNRTGRGVTPTLHGDRLFDHAHKILRVHDEALAELRGQSLEGSLRFGCPEDYANAFLPPLLSSFAQIHPQVSIDVVCGSTPRLLERLSRNDVDVALVSEETDDPNSGLRTEDLVWVAAKQSFPGNSVLRLALSDPDAIDHTAAIAALQRQGREFQVAYSSSSISGLLAVARSGQAVAVLTRSAVPADLRVLSPDSGLPRLPTVALVTRLDEKRATNVAKAFDEHVKGMLPTL